MKTSDFDFHLPPDRIALEPAFPKEAARLLHIRQGALSDRTIGDLSDLLKAGDVLVLNDTRVIPARLSGTRAPRQKNGQPATIEFTLHQSRGPLDWTAFAKSAKRLTVGDQIRFGDALSATIVDKSDGGECAVRFEGPADSFLTRLAEAGTMPLPPYIASKRAIVPRDMTDYQTNYARVDGAVAAPTAGLHFSDTLLDTLRAKGIVFVFVTLHVGAGTFLPVKTESVSDHKMHSEWGEVTKPAADALNQARVEGRRIVAVGTTSLRLLESAVTKNGVIVPFKSETDIFITPGHVFKSADVLLTNFHLPKSTLLMLIYAFGGTERMKQAYEHAITSGYRFYSFGDACLIERASL